MFSTSVVYLSNSDSDSTKNTKDREQEKEKRVFCCICSCESKIDKKRWKHSTYDYNGIPINIPKNHCEICDKSRVYPFEGYICDQCRAEFIERRKQGIKKRVKHRWFYLINKYRKKEKFNPKENEEWERSLEDVEVKETKKTRKEDLIVREDLLKNNKSAISNLFEDQVEDQILPEKFHERCISCINDFFSEQWSNSTEIGENGKIKEIKEFDFPTRLSYENLHGWIIKK
jgi:hypothetical protein